MRIARTYRDTLGPYWGYAVAVVILKALSGLLEVTGLIYLVQLIGVRYQKGVTGNLAVVQQAEALVLGPAPAPEHQILVFVCISLAAIALKHSAKICLGLTVVRVEHRIRKRMVESAVNLAWEKFVSMRLGQFHESVLGRSQHGVYGVQACVDFLSDAVTGVIFLGVSLWISPGITLLLSSIFLAVAVVLSSLKTRSSESLRRIPAYIRRLTHDLEGIVSSMKYLKEAGLLRYSTDRYLQSLGEHTRVHRHFYFFRAIPEALLDVTSMIILGSLLVLTLVLHWLDFTVAVTFLAIFYRLAPRMQLGFAHFLNMRAREPLLRDLSKLLHQMERGRDRARGTKRVTLSQEIRFENVSFRYNHGDEKFELREANFTLGWGKCVALVGSSGGGKSTFVDLLCGLFPPKAGRVLVDGTNLEEIDPHFWGRQVGLVLQSTPMIHASLLENVSLGDRDPDPVWAETCLRMANLGTLLDDAGVGLHTVVGQSGFRLSGGQQQRVALARALYRRPRLLILDEATSSLDSQTEEEFQEELERLRGKLSILMVAHRLKTVQMADEILVLEKGRIEQRGSWADLMSDPGGRFSELARRQGMTNRTRVTGPEFYASR